MLSLFVDHTPFIQAFQVLKVKNTLIHVNIQHMLQYAVTFLCLLQLSKLSGNLCMGSILQKRILFQKLPGGICSLTHHPCIRVDIRQNEAKLAAAAMIAYMER